MIGFLMLPSLRLILVIVYNLICAYRYSFTIGDSSPASKAFMSRTMFSINKAFPFFFAISRAFLRLWMISSFSFIDQVRCGWNVGFWGCFWKISVRTIVDHQWLQKPIQTFQLFDGFGNLAMRLYTDGNASWLVQTMDIEKEALWQTTLHLSLQQKQADFRSLLQQSQQDVGCSFGRQSLVRHANRCSICTVLGALRRKRPHT